ncbi:glycosyltransferase family 4 protein [Paraclostridium bifermentans]|uniref:glycosyltransferase family 4 protein n=1 Tax=Paraclostridium bifermentans TaxID=1490 RepID=UPI00241CA15A|nr:glycosyltransferase family 4 protein [Paraclostridium bifermentans]
MKKTNIMYLCKTMDYGGTEKVVINLCENLKDEFNKIIVCSSGGVYEEKLKELNIQHYCINDFEDKSIKNILSLLIKLIEIIKKENIDIIHSQHRFGTFLASIIKKITGTKVIHTAHNVFNDKKLMTKFISKVEFIAVGEKVKENLVNYYNIEPRKVNVIYNGISLDESDTFIVEEIEQLKQQKKFIVGNIGRVTEQKGFEYFVKSMVGVKKITEDVHYVIVGSGDKIDYIKKIIEENNLQKNITLLGFRKDIGNIINQLDLVVLSSLWEGFPLTPLEVFSQKNTIIATNVDGTSEIVKDGINGILIDSRDENQITKNVLKLYENKELLENLKANAFVTYKENFTLNLMISRYKQFYTDLVKGCLK